MKFDAHNTFSGGLYILQGRLQFTGDELTPTNGNHSQYINPGAGGTGAINIFPGAQWFPSGAGSFFYPGVVNNPINMAGNGINSDGTGAIRMGAALTLAGPVTLTGAARIGGGGGNTIIGTVTAAAANLGGTTANNPSFFLSLPVGQPAGWHGAGRHPGRQRDRPDLRSLPHEFRRQRQCRWQRHERLDQQSQQQLDRRHAD